MELTKKEEIQFFDKNKYPKRLLDHLNEQYKSADVTTHDGYGIYWSEDDDNLLVNSVTGETYLLEDLYEHEKHELLNAVGVWTKRKMK